MYSTDHIPAHMILGNLCWQKHEHEGTGQSLRYRISGDCALCARLREAERRGGYNPRKRIDVLNVTCETCGTIFHARPSQLPRKRFCSRACTWEGTKIDPQRTEKRCPLCQETKPREAFQISKSSIDGMRQYCRDCFAFNRNIARVKAGMTPREFRDWFTATLQSQENRCAICDAPLIPGNIAVDHDHSSGLLRGVLCNPCNLAIGLLREDVGRMRRAIRYVESHQ